MKKMDIVKDIKDIEAENTLEEIEIKLLLESIYLRYGFDFRNYAESSLKRRIEKRLNEEGLNTVTDLQKRILYDPSCMERLFLDFSVTYSAMFRDPEYYLFFREKVVPLLKTYPFIRVWHAGCSTGEEIYSTAILLEEEGIYDRCKIYATDMNAVVLKKSEKGIFPLKEMKEYTINYQKAGGTRTFSDYYSAKYDHAVFKESLKKNITFGQHNLVTDSSFNEFNIIICRNVMIYFNRTLQERVYKLFYESLCRLGYLVLGKKESLRFCGYEHCFETVDNAQKIYRKVK